MHLAATTRTSTFQQLFTLVAAFHAEFALTTEERETLFGITAPVTKRKARETAPLVDIASMNDEERRAHYAKTAPLENVRFALSIGGKSAELRAAFETLASKVDPSTYRYVGISAAEFKAEYLRLQRWARRERTAAEWQTGLSSPFDPAARILVNKAAAWQTARAIDRHNCYVSKRRTA